MYTNLYHWVHSNTKRAERFVELGTVYVTLAVVRISHITFEDH